MQRRIVVSPSVGSEVRRLADFVARHAALMSAAGQGITLCRCDLCGAAMKKLERLRGQQG